MRALTCFTTTLLVLGLGACGDDGSGTTTLPTTNTPTGNPTGDTDPSAGTTSGGTTDNTPTTTGIMTAPTTTGDDTSAGTTTDPTDGTTTDPTVATSTTDATTTDPGTGTTVDPSDGTTSGTTGVMPGEDLYGPCEMGMCPGDQQCVGIMGIDGEYCAPACGPMIDCPKPPAGVTAMPQCALTEPMQDEPTLCALICQLEMDGQCPAGETCKDAMQMQPIGICTAP